MCGIAGILSPKLSRDELLTRLEQMAQRMQHRGPDDAGKFIDEKAGVGLVHQRLSILDLSSAGHQPMQTNCSRYTVVFNGEIYNFRQLRAELVEEGTQFKSNSDTEVLLELYAAHGPAMVNQLAGMFAFAIWDNQQQSLFLARDSLGIKPLYVWQSNDQLAFASELRTVLKADIAPTVADRSALAQCLMFGSVPEPQTIVENIKLLPAGHTMIWKNGETQTNQYWDVGYSNEPLDSEHSVRRTREALNDTVLRHFVSDVPVGVFLSGGIDSTAVLALAKANGYDNVKTFCISFAEAEFNEGNRAARTAKHFGTDHHDWLMTPEAGGDLIEGFLESLDQPSNDGFNTYCVSKFARESGMKVVLSGVGGDELFGGYPSFQKVPQLMHWHRLARRFGVKGIAANFLPFLSQISANRLPRLVTDRIATFLRTDGGPMAAYWTMRAFFTPTEADALVNHLTGTVEGHTTFDALSGPVPEQLTDQDTVGYLESTRYMRNQLLRDSDVYSMAHGLELRVPLVDRHLYETVNQFPSAFRYRAGKKLLVEAVPEIPKWISEAPKAGFRFPFEDWVTNHWKPVFDQIDRESPVRMGTWYRKWNYFTLQHVLTELSLV